MQVQVNTDRNIAGDERLIEYVEGVIEGELERFAEQITRIEVHLGDENGAKPGDDDTRCMIEARLRGRKPTAVTHFGSNVQEAVGGAADKIVRALERELGRIRR
ncbi:MAG: HPF/RaiA family ribosome-associated protein [Myxococcota bacterium]